MTAGRGRGSSCSLSTGIRPFTRKRYSSGTARVCPQRAALASPEMPGGDKPSMGFERAARAGTRHTAGLECPGMSLVHILPRLVVAFFVLGAGLARAQAAGTVEAEQEVAPRNYGNFRLGASTSARRPTLCLELSPLEMLSVEGCGTGS